jgi:hypothetical protein
MSTGEKLTGDQFLQKHAEWKYGQKAVRKEEQPCTWLMSKSGYCFPLEGDLDSELKRLREMNMPCTVHHNQTSLTMKPMQDEAIRNRK